MKRLIKITAVTLAAGATLALAGCSGCAGCSKNNKNTAITDSNWYTGTGFSGIQPSFISGNENFSKEELVYDVTFSGANASNSSYSVEYKDGSFVTEFYAAKYDWNADGIPEYYRSGKSETLYYYKTVLNISVRYALKGGATSDWFDDSVVTESYFRSAEVNLQPVYSKQVLKTTSPAVMKAASLEEAYEKVDVTYENFYNGNCTEITSVITEAGKQPESKVYGGLQKLKYSLFDNSSLYIAMRSMKLSSSFSQTVNLFSAAAGGISSYNVYASNASLSETERKEISAVLETKELYKPVSAKDENGNETEDKGVVYNAVNVAYTGGTLNGTTPTVWYAAVENADDNRARATMLKMSVPLSYGLGNMNYVLKQVNSTLWNN